MKLGQEDVTSQGWWQQCWWVMLLSGSEKLVEGVSMLYLLDEGGAGRLERHFVPRMGSNLTLRGRVVGLSCPCTLCPLCFITAPLGDLIRPLLRCRAAHPHR